MTDFVTQSAVVAEFTVFLPDGRSFQVVNMTLEFCASIDVAKARAKEIGDDFVLNRGGSPVECLKRTLETLEATTAAGLKVVLKTAGFMIRVTPKPDINDGWGK